MNVINSHYTQTIISYISYFGNSGYKQPRPRLNIHIKTAIGEVFYTVLALITTLVYCWASVVDGWPAVKQCYDNVSCLLGTVS